MPLACVGARLKKSLCWHHFEGSSQSRELSSLVCFGVEVSPRYFSDFGKNEDYNFVVGNEYDKVDSM